LGHEAVVSSSSVRAIALDEEQARSLTVLLLHREPTARRWRRRGGQTAGGIAAYTG
jgi:hypothetical protein